MQEVIADAAGVPTTAVSLSLSPASVQVAITIQVPTNQAAGTVDKLAGGIFASASALEKALTWWRGGLKVAQITSMPYVASTPPHSTAPAPPPPPPLLPSLEPKCTRDTDCAAGLTCCNWDGDLGQNTEGVCGEVCALGAGPDGSPPSPPSSTFPRLAIGFAVGAAILVGVGGIALAFLLYSRSKKQGTTVQPRVVTYGQPVVTYGQPVQSSSARLYQTEGGRQVIRAQSIDDKGVTAV